MKRYKNAIIQCAIIVSLLSTPAKLIAQTDTVKLVNKYEMYLYKDSTLTEIIDSVTTGSIMEGKLCMNNKGVFSWKINYNGNTGYIEDLKELLEYSKTETQIKTEFEKKSKNGLVVLSYDWDYENEYSLAPDISFSIYNSAKKTIKYIFFYVSAYDAVDGVLNSFGKQVVSLKGIGPIPSGEKASYSFERFFYSKVISTIKVTKIMVQYMDGSAKTYSDIKAITFSP